MLKSRVGPVSVLFLLGGLLEVVGFLVHFFSPVEIDGLIWSEYLFEVGPIFLYFVLLSTHDSAKLGIEVPEIFPVLIASVTFFYMGGASNLVLLAFGLAALLFGRVAPPVLFP